MMWKRNYEKQPDGFTLIELVLYLGITSIMLIVVASFVQLMLESRIKHRVTSEVEQQGQLAINIIGQTLRNGTAICTPSAGTTAATLAINTGAGCGANQPTIFSIASGKLQMKEGAATAVDITNSRVSVSIVSSVLAKNLKVTTGVPVALQEDSVKVTFTINYVNNSGSRQEYSYTKNFQTSGSIN